MGNNYKCFALSMFCFSVDEKIYEILPKLIQLNLFFFLQVFRFAGFKLRFILN